MYIYKTMSNSIKVTICLLIWSIALIVIVSCQNYDYSVEKSGSCPPSLPVQICSYSCFVDSHCQGIGKCCSTTCGGTICTRPVTTRPREQRTKSGSCPAIPTGRWVCSSTCINDSDCQGTKKCCKNRCGALVCQRPEFEIVEPVGISFEPQPSVEPQPPIDPQPPIVPKPLQPPQPNNIIPTDVHGLNPSNPFLFNNN